MSDALAITGPVGYRRYHLENVCDAEHGHAHNYDHTTQILRGRILVIAQEKTGDCPSTKEPVLREVNRQEYGWGEKVYIPAGLWHTIKALEPNTVYECLFSHRDFDGLITQRYVGNDTAYR